MVDDICREHDLIYGYADEAPAQYRAEILAEADRRLVRRFTTWLELYGDKAPAELVKAVVHMKTAMGLAAGLRGPPAPEEQINVPADLEAMLDSRQAVPSAAPCAQARGRPSADEYRAQAEAALDAIEVPAYPDHIVELRHVAQRHPTWR